MVGDKKHGIILQALTHEIATAKKDIALYQALIIRLAKTCTVGFRFYTCHRSLYLFRVPRTMASENAEMVGDKKHGIILQASNQEIATAKKDLDNNQALIIRLAKTGTVGFSFLYPPSKLVFVSCAMNHGKNRPMYLEGLSGIKATILNSSNFLNSDMSHEIYTPGNSAYWLSALAGQTPGGFRVVLEFFVSFLFKQKRKVHRLS